MFRTLLLCLCLSAIISTPTLAATTIEVRSDVPGRLARLFAEKDSWIEQGEALFALSAAMEEASQSALQARIDSLRLGLFNHLSEAEAAMQENARKASDVSAV